MMSRVQGVSQEEYTTRHTGTNQTTRKEWKTRQSSHRQKKQHNNSNYMYTVHVT